MRRSVRLRPVTYLRALSRRRRLVLGTFAYVLCSIGGSALSTHATGPFGFSPWYPPAGLAFAYLAIVGVRGAPFVLVARMLGIAVAYPDTIQNELGWATLEAVLITACYAVGAEVFRRFSIARFEQREFALFTLVAVVATPIAATFATLGLHLAKAGMTFDRATSIVTSFWIGDAVAIAAIVPVALTLHHRFQFGHRPESGAGSPMQWGTFLWSSLMIACPILAVSLGGKNAVLLLAAGILPAVWMATHRDVLITTAGLCVLNLTVALGVVLSPLSHATVVNVQAMMLASSLVGLHIVASTRTHLRRQLEALERVQRGAEVNRTQSLAQMAVGISQDLRNYMTVVIGNAQLLPEEPDVKPFAEQISTAGRSASDLASWLADFAQARERELEPSNVRLLLDSLRPAIEAIGLDRVRMRYELDNDVWCLVNPVEFEQVVINLVTNAVDAIDESDVRNGEVSIGLASVTLLGDAVPMHREPGQYAAIRVSDNGTGIGHEHLPKVFDQFYSTKGNEGSGIGLATVRATMTAINGFIDVRTTPGKGTTFTLFVPQSDLDHQRHGTVVDQ